MKDKRELLEKFWDGDCSTEELMQVEILLNSASGRNMLDDIIERREKSKVINPAAPDDMRLELLRTKEVELMRHISDSKTSRRPFLTKTVALRWSAAAAFVGVIILSGIFLLSGDSGIGLFGGKAQTVQYAELTNPTGIPELHQLPDGTQIWLAAGSMLKYPETFEEKRRDVELTGEAFFDVARDEQRPFIIRTGEMRTRVLGTSFKITAFAGQEHEVSVATGKVSVSCKGKELALLTRGLQVRHNPATGETAQSEIDPASLDEWKSGALFFDKLPMSLVAKQLENRYGIEIEFADPTIESRRVRGKLYPQESIDEILNALGYIGNFQYNTIDKKHYTIY